MDTCRLSGDESKAVLDWMEAARTRIRELEEALKPFADYGEQMTGQWSQHDDNVHYGVKRVGAHQIKYGDFRRAMRVIKRAASLATGG